MALTWLKKGADSTALAEQAAQDAELQKEAQGKLWRFFIKEGEEARITFVDGELSDEGFLLPPRFFEHMVKHNGKWTNFVCPEKTNPHSGQHCPLCETGDKPSLVAAFTIIDHRIVSSKDGTKTYKDRKRLYVVKQQTFEMLNKLAVKRDGLVGTTWDVSRVGEKSPAAGNMFDYVGRETLKDLQETFKEEVMVDGKKVTQTYFTPANYEEEIPYYDEAGLRKLLGMVGAGGNSGAAKAAANQSFENEL